jgi:hypothetical protein
MLKISIRTHRSPQNERAMLKISIRTHKSPQKEHAMLKISIRASRRMSNNLITLIQFPLYLVTAQTDIYLT